jgi:hypothetical protein
MFKLQRGDTRERTRGTLFAAIKEQGSATRIANSVTPSVSR